MSELDASADLLSRDCSALELRLACRSGGFHRPTAGFAAGYDQANLVILPAEFAKDFQQFCESNPQACPLIEVTSEGNPEARLTAPGSDLRTDLPLYRIYRDGELIEEVREIQNLWRDDFVAFLLGCSFSFEAALEKNGLPVRHLHEKKVDGGPKNVPMYRTNRQCIAAGRFSGPLVVSMRPYKTEDFPRVSEITGQFIHSHGAPVHHGNPEEIGVRNIAQPDWGDAVTVSADEVPVFWACGVTSQAALIGARLPIAITHAPGHMFVMDEGISRQASVES